LFLKDDDDDEDDTGFFKSSKDIEDIEVERSAKELKESKTAQEVCSMFI
jgi:hypothetical protein